MSKPDSTWRMPGLGGGLLVVLSCILTFSCTGNRGSMRNGWFVQDVSVDQAGDQSSVEVRYRTGKLVQGWEVATTPPGDLAFFEPSAGTTLYIDTSCGSRYHDAPLNVLINHLLFGFTAVELLGEEPLELAGRAGLQRIVKAELDGVPVQVAVTVVKKGPCVFDMVLIGPPPSFPTAMPAYTTFLSGFEVEIGG